MPYKLSQAADSDIAAIAAYTIDTFGIAQADKYRDGLIRALEFIAAYPLAARERPELHAGTRAHPYRAHLIFYRQDGDGILVQRIRHAREDWINQPDAL